MPYTITTKHPVKPSALKYTIIYLKGVHFNSYYVHNSYNCVLFGRSINAKFYSAFVTEFLLKSAQYEQRTGATRQRQRNLHTLRLN